MSNDPDFDKRRAAFFASIEEEDRYLLALGRFISAFSQAEGAVQLAFWELAGVSSPIAQAVFSGVRVDAASSFIARIAAAKRWKAERTDKFQCTLLHLSEINRLRNDILHYGTSRRLAKDEWLVTNKTFAHIPKKVRNLRVSPALLDAATADLRIITMQIILLGCGKRMRAPPSMLAWARSQPWRYKSPPQEQARSRSRTTPPKR
jgi:hypothetical protein